MSKGLAIVIPIVTTVLGLCIGLWFAYQTSTGVYTPWQSLEAPPEKVSRIVTATLTTVYVQTIQGRIYSCNPVRPNECWHGDTLPQEIRLPHSCDFGYSPNLPCKANDAVELSTCDEEAIKTKYVLCEDGKVWTWQRIINPIVLPIDYSKIACPFCGVGFLVGIVPVVIWRKKKMDESRA